MTLQEINDWCRQNNIPEDTNVCIERGIELVEDVDRIIHNGIDLVLISKAYDEEVEI